MTPLEIAIVIFFAPVVVLFGIAVATAIVMLVYGSWIFMFAACGNQWARDQWRSF